jgi:hypothetical protein
MKLEEMKNLFGRLKNMSIEPEKVVKLCGKYFSGDTPTYELSILGARRDAYSLSRFLNDRDSGLPIIEELSRELMSFLFGKGYRNNILTYQEHLLSGSSGSGLNENPGKFPYTVGAVLNNNISVREAKKARKLNYIIGSALGKYWGVEGLHLLLLSEINDKGVTIKDPLLVDLKGNVVAKKLVDGAPFKR